MIDQMSDAEARRYAISRALSVLHYIEAAVLGEDRPSRAIQAAQAFVFGDGTERAMRRAGMAAREAGTALWGPAKHAALAAWACTSVAGGAQQAARWADESATAADQAAAGQQLASLRKRETYICAVCGTSFESIRYGDRERTCSNRCRQAHFRASSKPTQ